MHVKNNTLVQHPPHQWVLFPSVCQHAFPLSLQTIFYLVLTKIGNRPHLSVAINNLESSY